MKKGKANSRKTEDTTASTDNSKQGLSKGGKKVTVSLALDEAVVEKLKEQAASFNQSFNARVNEILEKYVNYFVIVEKERPAILTRSQHQFFVDEIDEEKYTNLLKQMGLEVIQAMFVETGMAITLENMIKFVFETLCINGGSITSVKRYIEEKDGRTCLYFTHDYDLKFSRILSAAFAHHIHKALHYHTDTQVFAQGFEIKIIERDPV